MTETQQKLVDALKKEIPDMELYDIFMLLKYLHAAFERQWDASWKQRKAAPKKPRKEAL